MKKDHKIPFVLSYKIEKALTYDYKKQGKDVSGFLATIPTNLRTELALVMHQSVIEMIPWL